MDAYRCRFGCGPNSEAREVIQRHDLAVPCFLPSKSISYIYTGASPHKGGSSGAPMPVTAVDPIGEVHEGFGTLASVATTVMKPYAPWRWALGRLVGTEPGCRSGKEGVWELVIILLLSEAATAVLEATCSASLGFPR